MVRRATANCCAAIVLALAAAGTPVQSEPAGLLKGPDVRSISESRAPRAGAGLLVRNAHAADVQEREAREREARIQEAREAMERARRSRGLVYFASRLLLGLSLVLVGVTLAAGRWKNLSEPVEVTLTALEGQRVLIGLAAIALAIIDIVLDLSVARPVIGDGLPQIAALLAGLTATKALVPDHAVLSRVREAIETLDVHKERLGIAAIAVGAIHLVAGIYPLI